MDKNNFLHSKMLTTKEVSDYLRIPVSSLCRLTKMGKIRGFKVGKHWRYRAEDILSFFEGTKEACNPSERRQHSRLNSEIAATLQSEINTKASRLQSGVIRDISQSGCFVLIDNENRDSSDESREGVRLFPKGIRVGDPVQIQFKILASDPKPMVCHGRLIHQTNHGMPGLGIKFRLMPSEQRKAIRNYVG